jgi:hypothetical protein
MEVRAGQRELSVGPARVPGMNDVWHHLPAPARPIAAATDAAIEAARERDREGLAGAVRDLAALDAAQVGLILGTTVRLLLEDRHPDGLTGDDVRAVLGSCVASAAGWQPDVDPHTVLILLAGALGVHDDDGPAPQPAELARHAALLLADQLEQRPTRAYLERALKEIEHTQLTD